MDRPMFFVQQLTASSRSETVSECFESLKQTEISKVLDSSRLKNRTLHNVFTVR